MTSYSVALQVRDNANQPFRRETFKVCAQDKNNARTTATEAAKRAGLIVGECFSVVEG